MAGKILSAAILTAVVGVSPALADFRGPAELPPASYQGQQYVDSRGCVFLRGGYGGQVTWVPRVTRDRTQMCGAPPSGRAVAVAPDASAAPKAAPEAPLAAPPKMAAATQPLAAPMKQTAFVAPAPTPVPARAPVAAAAASVEFSGEGNMRLACPADAPVPQRFEMHGGGAKTLCTTGDGSLRGASFPRLASGSLAGVAQGYDAHTSGTRSSKGAEAQVLSGAGGSIVVVPKAQTAQKSAKYPDPAPPPGYKKAWGDDRLNPKRGVQTVDGFVAMDEVWTRTTPAELREDVKPGKKVTVILRRIDGTQTSHEGLVATDANGQRVLEVSRSGKQTPLRIAVSSKSDPKLAPQTAQKTAPKAEAGAAAGRIFVQVGSFGQPSNAEGAAAKLKGQGLPVSRGKAKGGSLQVIYAGPFASAGEAKSALATARGLGFSDALILR